MAGYGPRPGKIPATYKGVGANADVGGSVPVGQGKKGPPTVTPTDRAPLKKGSGPFKEGTGRPATGRKADKETQGTKNTGKRATGNKNSTSAKKSGRSSGELTGGGY